MKTSSLSIIFLVLSLAFACAEPPKSGQSLGTITTSDGKTYANSKLAVIEPDGISILYADGGAKIPFTSLSPELQAQFGYTADKSAAYAREQALLAQIDALQQENAALRKRLNLAVARPAQQEEVAQIPFNPGTIDQPVQSKALTPPPSAPASNGSQPTIMGFHQYFMIYRSKVPGGRRKAVMGKE